MADKDKNEKSVILINFNRKRAGKFFKSILPYSNLAVALGTLVLAFVTYQSVQVSGRMAQATKRLADIGHEQLKATKDMAIETKRMVDLSEEQFKIRAYPAFLVVIGENYFVNDSLIQNYIIHNKGEISAYNVTVCNIHVYDKKPGLFFDTVFLSSYADEDGKSTYIHERTIIKDSFKTITTKSKILTGYSIERLMNSILFVKFKVPYDTQFRYEVFAYAFEEGIENTEKQQYRWDPISNNECKILLSRFLSLPSRSEIVEDFLGDFNLATSDSSMSD